jgi:hypothetical protein
MDTIQFDFRSPRSDPETKADAFMHKAWLLIQAFNHYPVYRRHLKFTYIVTKLETEARERLEKLRANGEDHDDELERFTKRMGDLKEDESSFQQHLLDMTGMTCFTFYSSLGALALVAQAVIRALITRLGCIFSILPYVMPPALLVLSYLLVYWLSRAMHLMGEKEDLEESVLDNMEVWRLQCIASEEVSRSIDEEEAKRKFIQHRDTWESEVTLLASEVQNSQVLLQEIEELSRQIQEEEEQMIADQIIWGKEMSKKLTLVEIKNELLKSLVNNPTRSAVIWLIELERRMEVLDESNMRL